jgi:hypothetical protein
VFNVAALVDLGDQGIRLGVIMPLADFGFFRGTGSSPAHPWRIRQNTLVPDEVRKSFETVRSQLLSPSLNASTTLTGTSILAVSFNLESAWMFQRKEGVPAPDDEYSVQTYLVLPSRHGGSDSSTARRAK